MSSQGVADGVILPITWSTLTSLGQTRDRDPGGERRQSRHIGQGSLIDVIANGREGGGKSKLVLLLAPPLHTCHRGRRELRQTFEDHFISVEVDSMTCHPCRQSKIPWGPISLPVSAQGDCRLSDSHGHEDT